MKRVLVTGAGGFVCSNIVSSLVDHDYQVIAVDRAFDSQIVAQFAQRGVSVITSDLTRLPDIEADYVIHGAAITADPADSETPEDHFRGNINPTLTMLDWARDHAVKRLIFISSSGVFRGSSAVVLTEETPVTPQGLYPVEKHAIELLIQTLKQQYNRDVIAVRLGNIYGCNEFVRPSRPRTSLVARMIQDALAAGRVGVPNMPSPVDWTYAGDIGNALHALLDEPVLQHPLYHVTSGQGFTASEIAKVLCEILPEVKSSIDYHNQVEFRGVMFPRHLLSDIKFNKWTNLRSGLLQTVNWFKGQMETSS